MMWVLVIAILTTGSGPNRVELATIEGFKTEADCFRAGEKSKNLHINRDKSYGPFVDFVCIEK